MIAVKLLSLQLDSAIIDPMTDVVKHNATNCVSNIYLLPPPPHPPFRDGCCDYNNLYVFPRVIAKAGWLLYISGIIFNEIMKHRLTLNTGSFELFKP